MNEKEYQTSGNMPAGQNGPDTQQDAAQYANTVQDNSYVKPRRHRRSGAGKIGIFALGVAVGIAFLAVAAHFFPVRTIAEQTIGVDSDPMSASDSALNQESIEKLKLLEDCIREYYYEPETATVETLENGMYKGLMDSLGDPYTVYYTPEEYNSMTEETSGVYKRRLPSR